MTSERALIANIRKHTVELVEAYRSGQHWYNQTMNLIDRTYRLSSSKLERRLKAIEEKGDYSILGWDDARWQQFVPLSGIDFPRLTRAGHLTEYGYFGDLKTPALLPIIGHRNVLIKAFGSAKKDALACQQSIMLRLLATTPPAKLRFVMIDPVGLGQNMAGFMHLSQFSEELVGGKIWTEANHIEQQLVNLTEHMEVVIQKYMLNRYPTMEAYNIDAGEVAEPYRVLTIANFPINFTDAAAQRLISIASNGPRTGVYVLAMMDTEAKLPYDFNLTDLERTALSINFQGERFVLDDPDFRDCQLELDKLPDAEQFNQIVLCMGEAAQVAGRVEVPFEKIMPPAAKWWTTKAEEELRAPIGKMGAQKILYFELGHGTAQHTLLVGKTGSGKSNLLHVIITSLALTHSPDEVEVYLVDFKKGVEFKDYAVHELPHARVVAIQSEREFGLSVLKGLDAELQRRGDMFRSEGYASLKDYRDKTGQVITRILLLVDEFQEFFSEDDALAGQAAQILDRLVRQGRAFGIHVLLASQSLAGSYMISRSTTDQMAVRIALQCSDADSRIILSDENAAARLLQRPGEAIYNAANGLVEGNNLFQVVLLTQEKREEYLRAIQKLAKSHQYRRSSPLIVFEGNAPADIAGNSRLTQFVTALPPSQSKAVYAWVGEPIEIKEHTAAIFRHQSRSHLLMVGKDEEAGVAMSVSAMISLASQYSSSGVQFCLLNLTNVDSDVHEYIENLKTIIPQMVLSVGQRDIPSVLGKLAREVDRRHKLVQNAGKPPFDIFIFVVGMQRARSLRSEDGYTPSEGSQQLAAILRDGADVGVHVVAWVDTYAGLERVLERRSIADFEQIVALQMSASESTNLLDSVAANKLGSHRAYYYHEERAGGLEKFRPYGIPDPKWLDWIKTNLRNREKQHR